MPYYNYVCLDCLKQIEEIKGDTVTENEEWEAIFEAKHTMDASKKEIKQATQCPRCESSKTEKTMIGTHIIGYVRGNGYLDKAGVHRDMNLCTLQTDDPYAEYRQAGETEHLTNKLKKAGQHNPKPKHYTVSNKTMEKAVAKAAATKLPD